MLTDFDITVPKIAGITTDNGSNVVNAVVQELNVDHMPCFAHTLNLVVNDSVFKSDASPAMTALTDVLTKGVFCWT
jgi:hypothetical protein